MRARRSALASAIAEYAALRGESQRDGTTVGDTPAVTDADFERFLDRVTTHVEASIDALRRETADIEGLVRFTGDDWRTAELG